METTITRLFRLPPLASEHGGAIDRLLLYIHLLMIVLFIGWAAYFLYVLWRFHQRRQPKADPAGARTQTSTYLEVGVAVVEGILLFGLALPIWSRTAIASNFPKPEESTVVRIIGRQFNWMARYPGPDGVFGRASPELVAPDNPLGVDRDDPAAADDILLESSEVVVPVGKPVIAYISSLDVMHSFSVKALRVTQDAIPGISNPVWFTPIKTGTYQITCAQLCGNGHYSMRGILRVLPPDEYEQWFAQQSPRAADTSGYE